MMVEISLFPFWPLWTPAPFSLDPPVVIAVVPPLPLRTPAPLPPRPERPIAYLLPDLVVLDLLHLPVVPSVVLSELSHCLLDLHLMDQQTAGLSLQEALPVLQG